MNLLAKFVALTHSKTYTDFITHAPLSAALVLGNHSVWMFAFAASIGLWKDLILDRFFQPDWNEHDAIQAAVFCMAGAVGGVLWRVW